MEQTQFLARMPRNLWRIRDRMNFPVAGLVLYLPLWHPELSGSPFLSKDLNAHSCTVVGATHGRLGRTIDGIDDWIAVARAISLEPTTAITVALRIYANSLQTGWRVLLTKYPDGNNNRGYQLFKSDTHKIRWGLGDGSAFKDAYSNSAISATTWYLIIGTYDGVEVALYIDNIKQADTHAFTGTISHPTDDLLIGGRIVLADSFGGIIGEGWVWNRALSALERQQVKLATEWRYR